MDSEQKHTTYSSMTVPRKSKLAGKKPPAPPPRKSSVPGASQGQNCSAQKLPAPIPSQANHLKGDTETSFPPLPPPPPPYNVLVPSLPTPANSSAFPSREPKPRLPRSQSSNQMNHGKQFDIHGDVIVEQMLPVQVTAPQPPPSTVNHERDHLTPKKTSASLTLKELADYHFPKFPLQVQILEGYMSSHVPHLTLSTADIYNIHLLKRQEVIVAKDSLGHKYDIPLNTAINFGLLPSNEVLQAYYGKSDQESNTDLSFTKVSDILAMKVLPKVVCAIRASKNEGDKGSVEGGEVLVVQKVSKLKKKKVLEVYSITKKAQKVLSHDCCGHFTTSPRQVAMQLPDLIEHVSDVLPCQVFLFFNEDRTSEKSSFSSTSLSNGVVTLTQRKVETSLVASSVLEDVEIDLNSDDSLLDIPLDENLSQIEVAIVKSADVYSRKRLRTATQNILKNVNLSKLRSYRDAASDNVYVAQTMLYSAHNAENERLGVEFETPLGINQESTSSQPEAYDIVPQRNKNSEGELMYETIADVTSSTKKYSDSVQNKTGNDRSSASVAALDDDVFTSEKRPLPSIITSNLDSHPRAQIIREGFYKSPRLQPAGYVPDTYDFPPARHVIAKPKKSLSAGGGRLSSSSLSINHPPATAQEKLSLDTASVPFRQNKISGSLDDILAYEDMQSVRSSYASQLGLMGDSEYEVFNPPPASHQKIAALDDKLRLLQKENEMLSEKVASLEQSKLSISLQNAVDRIEDLESKLKLCMEQLQGSDGQVKEKEGSKMADTVNKQHNRELLQTATTDEILQVLDSMGLPQYKEIFLQERIDGAVLLELDAEVLRRELGIKSKIHCIKLTKLISGDHSIQQFLQNP